MPQITVYGLRANLRRVLDELAATGEPVILAERGRRPVAVLVSYAAWQAAPPDAGRLAALERDLAAAQAQVAQLAADLAAARAVKPASGPAGAAWGAGEPSRWGQRG